MSTPVVMPQMGESIAEGTIVRWIKQVGDSVDRDEPLFEISTDKVDAEIPAPAAGVLTEIQVQAGETVAVNEVVATIGDVQKWPNRPTRPRRPSRARRDQPRSHRPTVQGPLRKAPATRPTVAKGRSLQPLPPRSMMTTVVVSDPRRSFAESPRSTTSTSRRFTAQVSAAA